MRTAGEFVLPPFLARASSCFEISARGQFVDGLYTRPRKFRDIALALEVLVETCRPEQRHSNQCRSRCREASETGSETHTISVQPPADDDRDSRQRGRQQDPPAQAGKYIQQKRRRIAIHDHHIEEVDRHPELVELEARQQRQRDQDFQGDERRHDRPAQQDQPKAVEHDPDESEDGHAHGGGLGRDHEDDRAGMQQRREAESGRPTAATPAHGAAAAENT